MSEFYIDCPIHGRVETTEEEVNRQKRANVRQLLCPIGRPPEWFEKESYEPKVDKGYDLRSKENRLKIGRSKEMEVND